MNKANTLNEDIAKVLNILERRFEIGTQSNLPDDFIDGRLRAGIWMSDLVDTNLSVEGCWDILSVLSARIDGFKVIGKFKTGYKNEKYEELASKVDEPPPIFEVLLPENFIMISKDISNDLLISEKNYWITKDRNTNEYHFDGNKIHIKNKDADYAKVFDAVFSLIPQGGDVSYPDVIAQCKRSRLGVDQSAIQRALTGEKANFFLYVSDVKQLPDHGIPLFEASRNGKKLTFNNKR